MCARERKGERGWRDRDRGGEREGGGERSPSEKEDYPTHISTDITDCPLIILYTKLLISCNSTRHVLLALRWGGGGGGVKGVMRSKTNREISIGTPRQTVHWAVPDTVFVLPLISET